MNFQFDERALYDTLLIIAHKATLPNVCKHEDCMENAYYNFPGESAPRYCRKHQKIDMISVRNTVCEFPLCGKRPMYNFKGEEKSIFCAGHSTDDMIDLVHPICEHDGCSVIASYDFPGKSRRYCSKHKLDGMITRATKYCKDKDCNNRATHNFKGKKGGLYCENHAPNGMMNVIVRTCCKDKCTLPVTHGFPGHQSTHCSSHKEIGMVRNPRKRCTYPRCKLQAHYGIRGSGPKHCDIHQTPDDINLVEKPCTNCNLLNIVNSANLCMYCDPVQQRATKIKEINVQRWLDSEKLFYISHDRMIDGGVCIKNRPDFIFDAGTHMVVLEVDEHQHQSYACECEQARMINIAQALGIATMFIRYNPDAYRGPNNKRLNPSHPTRKKDLISRLHTALQKPPSAFCEAIYLYYDGYAGDQEPTCILSAYD